MGILGLGKEWYEVEQTEKSCSASNPITISGISIFELKSLTQQPKTSMNSHLRAVIHNNSSLLVGAHCNNRATHLDNPVQDNI